MIQFVFLLVTILSGIGIWTLVANAKFNPSLWAYEKPYHQIRRACGCCYASWFEMGKYHEQFKLCSNHSFSSGIALERYEAVRDMFFTDTNAINNDSK